MEFDPFLYVAFLAGLVAGWWVRPTTPWVGRVTLVTVGVLVGLLGASLDAVPVGSLLTTIPLAFSSDEPLAPPANLQAPPLLVSIFDIGVIDCVPATIADWPVPEPPAT